MSVSRIYIANVSYSSSEEDLREFLKDFNFSSVLIPCHTVRRFRRNEARSFGIAYVDFTSSEEAVRAVEELNGKEFGGRVLRVRTHNPYQPPKPIKERFGTKLQQLKKFAKYEDTAASGERAPTDAQDHPDQPQEGHMSPDVVLVNGTTDEEQQLANVINDPVTNADAPGTEQNISKEKAISEDTVYCAFLPKETTDNDLRNYFTDYGSREIWIFRTKNVSNSRFRFRNRNHTAALVTLSTELPLNKVIEELLGKKLLGTKISIKPAYIYKINEVKKIAEQSHMLATEYRHQNGNSDVVIGTPNEALLNSTQVASQIIGSNPEIEVSNQNSSSIANDAETNRNVGDTPITKLDSRNNIKIVNIGNPQDKTKKNQPNDNKELNKIDLETKNDSLHLESICDPIISIDMSGMTKQSVGSNKKKNKKKKSARGKEVRKLSVSNTTTQ